MTVEVEIINKKDDKVYQHFLNNVAKSSSYVLGYHYPFYRDILLKTLSNSKDMYLGAWEKDRLVGVLPGIVKQSKHGPVYNSLPFFGPNAGIIVEDSSNLREIHQILLGKLLDLAAHMSFIALSIYTPLGFTQFELYDECLRDCYITEKFTQMQPIAPFLTWPRKVRYDIQRAIASGVRLHTEITPEVIDAFYRIYEQNCSERSIPQKPRECIVMLLDQGVADGHVDFSWASIDGEMIAGLITILGGHVLSYYLPCSTHEGRKYQAPLFLIDASARRVPSLGIRIWNWESSPSRESGVYAFKKRCGGQESVYRIYTKVLSETILREVGKDGIKDGYPYFFVVPFARLEV